MRLQMQEAQQQQQLAALLMMQEAAGGFPGSLLSSGSAQGSSNLIYLLKSLQVRLQHLRSGMSEQSWLQVRKCYFSATECVSQLA